MRLSLLTTLLLAMSLAPPLASQGLPKETRRGLDAAVDRLDLDASPTNPPILRQICQRHGFAALRDALALTTRGDDAGRAGRAALVLAALGDRRANPALLTLVSSKTPLDLRRRAIEALVRLGERGATLPLTKLLADDDRRDDRDVIDAVWLLRDPRALPALLRALKHPSADCRKVVPRALVALGAKQAAPALIAQLGDGDRWVRKSAAGALGQLGHRPAIPHLLRLLTDPERWVRLEARVALAELAHPATLAQLPGLLPRLDHPMLRRALAVLRRRMPANFIALMKRGLPSRFTGLYGRELLRLKPLGPDVVLTQLDRLKRHEQVRLIGHLILDGDSRGGKRLLHLARDPENPAGATTLRLLGIGRVEGSLKLLLDSLDGEGVGQAAALALGDLGDRAAVKPLERALAAQTDSRGTILRLTRSLLLLAPAPARARALRQLVRDRWDARELALVIEALGRVRDTASLGFLRASLDDHRRVRDASWGLPLYDKTIQGAAREALARIQGKRGTEEDRGK